MAEQSSNRSKTKVLNNSEMTRQDGNATNYEADLSKEQSGENYGDRIANPVFPADSGAAVLADMDHLANSNMGYHKTNPCISLALHQNVYAVNGNNTAYHSELYQQESANGNYSNVQNHPNSQPPPALSAYSCSDHFSESDRKLVKIGASGSADCKTTTSGSSASSMSSIQPLSGNSQKRPSSPKSWREQRSASPANNTVNALIPQSSAVQPYSHSKKLQQRNSRKDNDSATHWRPFTTMSSITASEVSEDSYQKYYHSSINTKNRYTAEENLFILRARDRQDKIPWGIMPDIASRWYSVSRGRNNRNMQVHYSQSINTHLSRFDQLNTSMQHEFRRILNHKLQILYEGVIEEMENVVADKHKFKPPKALVANYMKRWLEASKKRLQHSLEDALQVKAAAQESRLKKPTPRPRKSRDS